MDVLADVSSPVFRSLDNLILFQAYESFLYAGLMLADMVVFTVMTLFYKYVEIPDDEDSNTDIPLEKKSGNVNDAYKEDEK